jgi:hypothetical protein
MSVRVVINDSDGKDVTDKIFIIPMGLRGIGNLDGSESLLAGRQMIANWQFVPGDGLGGTEPGGKLYYAKAVISYYINGRYVETQSKSEEITILPQPKIKLNYYVPHRVTANQPFRLGVMAENLGDGAANNLVIDSGQLEFKSNLAGLLTRFEIIGTSFGNSTDNTFRLNFGKIEPHSQVSGYWLVKWVVPEEGEGSEPLEGEFIDFKATLHHQDYNGVQLNPLIIEVTTSIIGRDNLFAKENEPDNAWTLIDEGQTGIPDYLINFKTGMKLPVYVPYNLKVNKQPDNNKKTLEFEVPALVNDPDSPDSPRYQVLMLKDTYENAVYLLPLLSNTIAGSSSA